MMLRVVRGGLLVLLAAEFLPVALAVAGVRPPAGVVVAAETAGTAFLALTGVAAARLYRAARRSGAPRRGALRAAAGHLVPERVRRLVGFDAKGLASLGLWVLRRRHGVPPGAVAVPYAGEQTAMLTLLLIVMGMETAAMEFLLRGVGAPAGLRTLILVADVYSIVLCLAILAACVTRPHVVSDRELRIRYGAFFDLRVPRDRISSVRLVRNFNESGGVRADGDRLAVAVSAQTNVVVELAEPAEFVRPLGRRGEARAVRFFADEPRAVLDALAAGPGGAVAVSSPPGPGGAGGRRPTAAA